MSEPLSCWVISDGRRGIENQALGLAESVSALRPAGLQVFQTDMSRSFSAASPGLQFALKSRMADYGLPLIAPDIAIGCGRQAIAPLLAIKKAAPASFTAYVQDPRMDPAKFDLVIAPEHDATSGPNVVSMIGSPNRISEARIVGETLGHADGLAKLPTPRAAILIGGTSKRHKLDTQTHSAHLAAAQNLLSKGWSVLVTTSRRTPEFARKDWARLASGHDRVWLYGGDGPNPYFAFLGAADMILVTEDSTNMLTEACALGKPVYRLPMGGAPGKFTQLYEALESRCGAAAYDGQMGGKDFAPLLETQRVAAALLTAFDDR